MGGCCCKRKRAGKKKGAGGGRGQAVPQTSAASDQNVAAAALDDAAQPQAGGGTAARRGRVKSADSNELQDMAEPGASLRGATPQSDERRVQLDQKTQPTALPEKRKKSGDTQSRSQMPSPSLVGGRGDRALSCTPYPTEAAPLFSAHGPGGKSSGERRRQRSKGSRGRISKTARNIREGVAVHVTNRVIKGDMGAHDRDGTLRDVPVEMPHVDDGARPPAEPLDQPEPRRAALADTDYSGNSDTP